MARTVSTDVTLSSGEDYLWVDASGGNRIITLTPLGTLAQHLFIIIKSDTTANTVTVQRAGTDQIMNDTSVVLTQFGQSVQLLSGPSQWWIL